MTIGESRFTYNQPVKSFHLYLVVSWGAHGARPLGAEGMMRALKQEQKDEAEKNDACNKARRGCQFGDGQISLMTNKL